MTPQWHKLILWGIREETSHQAKPKQKQYSHKSRSKSHKRYSSEHKNQRPPFKKFDPSQAPKEIDAQNVVIPNMLKVSSVLQGSSSARPVTNMVIFSSLSYKKQSPFKSRNSKAHQLQVGVVYAQEDSVCGQSSDLTSSYESFYLQVKIQCT